MDFSFVSPHPVSAARLQVACATDRYKMFSHRAQRSLAAERRGQARCVAGTCVGKGMAAQGHLPVCHAEGCAAPAQPACPGRSPATMRCALLRTHTPVGAHTQESPPPAEAPQTTPTNSAVPTPPQGTRQLCSGESSSTFTTNQPPHHSAFCVGFFFSSPLSPSFKGSS